MKQSVTCFDCQERSAVCTGLCKTCYHRRYMAAYKGQDPEPVVVQRVVEWLRAEGFTCTENVGLPKKGGGIEGRIDIVAERDDEVRLIEVKRSPRTTYVSNAISQLHGYSSAMPHASLWFAAPSDPSDHLCAILAEKNIQILPWRQTAKSA